MLTVPFLGCALGSPRTGLEGVVGTLVLAVLEDEVRGGVGLLEVVLAAPVSVVEAPEEGRVATLGN